ncbi:hypothetical protein K490DRAFT_49040 [Saccharata proteae CBS 121410]|uniref:Uncharacterized protein n=1 Tax=Saccharata proteae CBS 121410 TaxID=1314787 RepID=A0A9P4HMT7_9PEZI|nr:hypothetical protein K490DRAFT_49040 [Saccharata proteae CBS 121410]
MPPYTTPFICLRCLRNQRNVVTSGPKHGLRNIVRELATSAEDGSVSNSTSPDSNNTTTVTARYVKGEQRTYKRREQGHRPLPLPPIMDPIAVAARERWKQPKPYPDLKNITPFQERLYKNAWAVALATSKRMCAVTLARLPSHFLLELRPSLHPETKDPWLLPTVYHSKASATPDVHNDFPPARTVMRHDFVHWIRLKKRWRDAVNVRLATRLDNVLGGGSIKRLVWREDMASLVGERLGAVVMRKLTWFLGRNGSRKFTMPGIEDIEEVDGVAAVLFLRPLTSPKVKELEDAVAKVAEDGAFMMGAFDNLVDDYRKERGEASGSHFDKSLRPVLPRLQPSLLFPPLKWRTMRWRGKEVPVYDLVELLGETRCKELVKGTWFEDFGSVVLREDSKTVSAHLALIQLQNYYAKSIA